MNNYNYKKRSKTLTHEPRMVKVELRALRNTKLVIILLVLVMVATLLAGSVLSMLLAKVTIPSSGTISTSANTVTASSGYPDDIQAAVDTVNVAGGGTVYIPAGIFSWTASDFHGSPPRGVDSYGKINIIGAGKGVTVLQVVEKPPNRAEMFIIDGKARNADSQMRLSGITFKGYQPADLTEEQTIMTRGVTIKNVQDFRVDNCEFINFCQMLLNIMAETGYKTRGVVDHNFFDNPYKDILGEQAVGGYGTGMAGDGSFAESIDTFLGKYDGLSNVAYFEDNHFKRLRHGLDQSGGGWVVARHNIFEEPRPYSQIDVHCVEPRVGRGLEVYDNDLDGWNSLAGHVMGEAAVLFRGGGGVVFNNIMKNSSIGIAMTLAYGPTEEHKPQDIWIWDNSMTNINTPVDVPAGYTEGVEYHLEARPGYVPYPYPHPLTLESIGSYLSPRFDSEAYSRPVATIQNIASDDNTRRLSVTAENVKRLI